MEWIRNQYYCSIYFDLKSWTIDKIDIKTTRDLNGNNCTRTNFIPTQIVPGRVLCTVLVTIPWVGPPTCSVIESHSIEYLIYISLSLCFTSKRKKTRLFRSYPGSFAICQFFSCKRCPCMIGCPIPSVIFNCNICVLFYKHHSLSFPEIGNANSKPNNLCKRILEFLLVSCWRVMLYISGYTIHQFIDCKIFWNKRWILFKALNRDM